MRFIPACAGNTTATPSSTRWRPVHPRLRGEHSWAGFASAMLYGSSPPARGTRRAVAVVHALDWFIPACAGNTRPASVDLPDRPVHPRLRGEHHVAGSRTHPKDGSSPPARGTRPIDVHRNERTRFIPACAGNTYNPFRHPPPVTVHPRLRGEHVAAFLQEAFVSGSSPPARGTRSAGALVRTLVRFIPACAGNTSPPRASTTNWLVHPRLRGEHACAAVKSYTFDGSSPPARGTRATANARRVKMRFIPACAGNTACTRPNAGQEPVHPRLRGEHISCSRMRLKASGSSPPARGTRAATGKSVTSLRFIPACAGNTIEFPFFSTH